MDRRIGHRLRGAVDGGPCFPRDNVRQRLRLRSVGARADIAVATGRSTEGSSTGLSAWCARTRARASIASGCWDFLQTRDAGRRRKPGGDAGESSGRAGFATLVRPCRIAGCRSRARSVTWHARGARRRCIETCDVLVLMVPLPEFREIPALLRAGAGNRPLSSTAGDSLRPRSLKDSPSCSPRKGVGTERCRRSHEVEAPPNRHQIELLVMKLGIGPNRDVASERLLRS